MKLPQKICAAWKQFKINKMLNEKPHHERLQNQKDKKEAHGRVQPEKGVTQKSEKCKVKKSTT